MVHTAPWPHCPNRNVVSDRRNSLYDKAMSFRCDGRLFHSPAPAAANALSPEVLCVRVTTHDTGVGDKSVVAGNNFISQHNPVDFTQHSIS